VTLGVNTEQVFAPRPHSTVEVLETVATRVGQMELSRLDTDYAISIDGEELMASQNHQSEDELGLLAAEQLRHLRDPRILIGGLGLGYTVRAALDALPDAARVEVAELVPEVVRWNRTVLGHLADHPLDDPRVTLIEDDVAQVIVQSPGRYDAIVLDVDNGPDGISESNAALYLQAGLSTILAALQPEGLLAIWSAFDSLHFTRELQLAGFDVEVQNFRSWHGGGATHTIGLARPHRG
jgi:spermidine synthase